MTNPMIDSGDVREVSTPVTEVENVNDEPLTVEIASDIRAGSPTCSSYSGCYSHLA